MSDEYNDGFEAGYAYAKKEFEKEKERMIERLKAWESTCVKKQNYNGAQAFKIAGEVVMNDEEQLRGKS